MGNEEKAVKKNGNGSGTKLTLASALAVFGAAMAFFFIPYSNLSGDVRANTERIKAQEKSLDRIETKVDKIDAKLDAVLIKPR